MSKTNLLSIMENKLSNPPFPGYNASYDGDCSKFLFNKLLGDEVHSNGFTDISLLTELSESTVHHYEEITSPAVPTYTLDDLIDLAADVSENDHENAFNILFDTEDLSELPTDVPSPLSSISDDSCDLQVLLNNFNSSFQDTLANYDTSNNPIDESLDSESIDIDETGTLFEATICNTSQDCAAEYLSDLTNKNTVRFADLYSLLQNQITSITDDSQGDDNLKDTSSSESGDDDQRYSPYKKPKKSRTPEQKIRKKTQNRNAAEKYRSKKKDELKSMNEEASRLERTNKELKSKVQGLHTEIGYLKNLMLDVIKARLSKGTISVYS